MSDWTEEQYQEEDLAEELHNAKLAKLEFEPDDYADQDAWRTYRLPTTEDEVEIMLERIAALRDEIERIYDHANSFIQAKEAEFEEFKRKVALYQEKTTRPLVRRVNWLIEGLDAYLRTQDQDVRSMRFINGLLKRRAVPEKYKIVNAKQAVEWLQQSGFEDCLKQKVSYAPIAKQVTEKIKEGEINAEAVEWVEYTPRYDKVEIVTPKYKTLKNEQENV